jgi:hypothetical protein
MSINFKEQFKIRCKESSMSQAKHLVVKSLIVLMLKDKYKNQVIVETERLIGRGIVCDVYQELPKEKNKIAYEVQKELTPQYIKETTKKYARFINLDLVIIPLKELPNDLDELIEKLSEYII